MSYFLNEIETFYFGSLKLTSTYLKFIKCSWTRLIRTGLFRILCYSKLETIFLGFVPHSFTICYFELSLSRTIFRFPWDSYKRGHILKTECSSARSLDHSLYFLRYGSLNVAVRGWIELKLIFGVVMKEKYTFIILAGRFTCPCHTRFANEREGHRIIITSLLITRWVPYIKDLFIPLH